MHAPIVDDIGQELRVGDIVAHTSPGHGTSYTRPAVIVDLLPTKKMSVHVRYGRWHQGIFIANENKETRWGASDFERKVYPHVLTRTAYSLDMSIECMSCGGFGHNFMHERPAFKDMDNKWA